jgi:hypothetical protein
MQRHFEAADAAIAEIFGHPTRATRPRRRRT